MSQLGSDLSLHEDTSNGECSSKILFFPTILTELLSCLHVQYMCVCVFLCVWEW